MAFRLWGAIAGGSTDVFLRCLFVCATSYSNTTAIMLEVTALLPQLIVMLWVSPRILKNHIFVHSITHINQSIVEEVMEIMETVRLGKARLACRGST